MRKEWDFIVIGGGASGIAAAIAASAVGDHVLIIEKSSAIGKKISASGNGRCNLMNTGKLKYYGDSRFASDVLEAFTPEKLICFWSELGLHLTQEDGGRVYPCTFQSSSVLDVLKISLKSYHVDILYQTAVLDIRKDHNTFYLTTSGGSYCAGRILIAAGGAAAPKLGGTDSGYKLLKKLGHSINPPFPALCPLLTDTKSISGLSGIRVRCGIRLLDQSNHLLHQEKGELLFTDYGISGICAMQCARFYREGSIARLDFTDRVFNSREDLINCLLYRKKQIQNQSAETILYGILVPRLSFAVLKQAGINTGKTAGDLTDADIIAIANSLSAYTVTILGTKGLDESQTSAGGAVCGEFNPATMESKLLPGLHVSGEVLNVDGDCGGYNLMFAFASGILAGSNGRMTGEKSYEKR